MSKRIRVEVGSDNIFADLGLPDAKAHFLKAQIVSEIYRLAKQRRLTQAQAGKRMGISQPEVSRMFKGQLSGIFGRSPDGVAVLVRPDHNLDIAVEGRQGRQAGPHYFHPGRPMTLVAGRQSRI